MKDPHFDQPELELIILICGDSKTGKKSIVNSIVREKEKEKNFKLYKGKKGNSTHKSISFKYEEKLGNSKIEIPVEFRILNSEQMDKELKYNKNFFNNALGAFVINSTNDKNSFINGEKWKDKIDLMCCLPNHYPLPIFLLINKCDLLNDNNIKNSEYLQKDKIEEYSKNNQFFKTFFTQTIENKNNKIDDDNNINNKENDFGNLIETPKKVFEEMVQVIMGFKDIRNIFIIKGGGIPDDRESNEGNQKNIKKCSIF